VAHLALLDDKSYWFSPGGSLAAYGVSAGCAVALGDPIGPPEDLEPAIFGFAAWARQHGWWPVFGMTSHETLAVYRRLGFRCACFGHEALIDLPRFELSGNAHKTIRRRYQRLCQMGYRLQIVEPPVADEVLSQLRAISQAWLSAGKGAEKGFFLTRFDEAYLANERLALAVSAQGQIEAFINLIPEYGAGEISLDLMRRRIGSEAGVMDFLFAALFLWARQAGYQTFNMGLSPLYGVGQAPRSSMVERLFAFTYAHMNIYDFKGLNSFKIKFRPHWQPQYLIYPSRRSLPQVGMALARLNAGENNSIWNFVFPKKKPATELQAD
jgi:phosphatidylglycerol lysyltransferase